MTVTILNAAVSGELIPATEARLAVALAYQLAAEIRVPGIVGMADLRPETKAAILALADTDALAEVQKLRDERDALKQYIDRWSYADLEAESNRAEAAEAKLAEWQASQGYAYIGRDGKTVLARDLEDRAEAEHDRGNRLADKLVAAEARADAAVTAAGDLQKLLGRAYEALGEDLEPRQFNSLMKAIERAATRAAIGGVE